MSVIVEGQSYRGYGAFLALQFDGTTAPNVPVEFRIAGALVTPRSVDSQAGNPELVSLTTDGAGVVPDVLLPDFTGQDVEATVKVQSRTFRLVSTDVPDLAVTASTAAEAAEASATASAASAAAAQAAAEAAASGGGGGGVTNHAGLTGLDQDDHTQYARADGSRGAFASPTHTHPTYATPADLAANSTFDRNRANHTGSNPISSVSGLQDALNGKQGTIAQVDTLAAASAVPVGSFVVVRNP